MCRDPIVEDIRKRREEYAARFNYDIKAICREARKHQAASQRETVSRPPRRSTSVAPAEVQPSR